MAGNSALFGKTLAAKNVSAPDNDSYLCAEFVDLYNPFGNRLKLPAVDTAAA